jgi:hypothetical protein
VGPEIAAQVGLASAAALNRWNLHVVGVFVV